MVGERKNYIFYIVKHENSLVNYHLKVFLCDVHIHNIDTQATIVFNYKINIDMSI